MRVPTVATVGNFGCCDTSNAAQSFHHVFNFGFLPKLLFRTSLPLEQVGQIIALVMAIGERHQIHVTAALLPTIDRRLHFLAATLSDFASAERTRPYTATTLYVVVVGFFSFLVISYRYLLTSVYAPF